MEVMMNEANPCNNQNPLNTHLVVENAMCFLGMADLKNCRAVSKLWRCFANKAMGAKNESLVARIRPDELKRGGKSSLTDFMTMNSVETYNFRLDGFDLSNLKSFDVFAKENLKKAKSVSFLNCLWNYAGLNNLLRDMKSLEVLVIQTRIHIPVLQFRAEHFGKMHFPFLKRIDIRSTIQYSARHLACISRASPMLREVNTVSDTQTLVTSLIICPELVSKVTALWITPEWEHAQWMMTALARRRLQLSSLTIGLGTLNL